MKMIITGVIALVVVCRFAHAGAVGPAADPLMSVFRLLADFGALGAFIVYLIWQKREDGKKQDEASKRWYSMDQSLFALVEKSTLAITESTGAISEIRVAIHENNRELRRINTILATGKPHTRRESDTDIHP